MKLFLVVFCRIIAFEGGSVPKENLAGRYCHSKMRLPRLGLQKLAIGCEIWLGMAKNATGLNSF